MEPIDRTGQGNIPKIVSLGLQDRLFEEMKKPDFNVEKFKRELESEGIKISSQVIRKFINNSKEAQKELIAKDLQASEVYKQTIMDYGKELKNIMDEVKDMKALAKDQNDFASYNQMVSRLMQGIELIAKITGDIKPKGSVDINLIYNEINANIEDVNKKMRDDIFKNVVNVDYEIEEEDKEEESKINGE